MVVLHRLVLTDPVVLGAELLYSRPLAGGGVTFDSYVNGWPVAQWRELLPHLRQVRVRLRVAGPGQVTIVGCGVATPTERRVVHRAAAPSGGDSDAAAEWLVDVVVPLGVADWVWCETTAAQVLSGEVIVDEPASAPASVVFGVAITTCGRPRECIQVITDLLTLPPEVIGQVTVVDQSPNPDDAALVADFCAALTDPRVSYVPQGNFGGSGGFTRGMLAIRDTSASHVVLMDDDVVLEPELLRRAHALCAAGWSGIIGAHMFSLTHPTVLNSTAEKYSPATYVWHTPEDGLHQRSLASGVQALLPNALRHDPDFCGWWTCIIPVAVFDRVGYSLPVFIKFDDVEFSLRAADAGTPITMLAGCAVWHLPWTAKDAATDWQGYFASRNRLITAALRGRDVRPTLMLARMSARAVVHCATLAYDSAERICLAIEDVLAGPGQVESLFAQQRTAAEDRLPVAGVTPEVPAGAGGPVKTVLPAWLWPVEVVLRSWVSGLGGGAGVLTLAAAEVTPRAVAGAERVQVRSASGEFTSVRVRDRRRAVALTVRVAVGAVRLWGAWPRVVADFGAARESLTSAESWRRRLNLHK